MKNYIYEDYSVDGLQIVEAKKEALPEGVLAKVSGPSFFLDGFSRNGRFYPKELWENALKKPETKQALDRGLMFGCIGHPKDYTLDELLESGKVSHKVTGIKIDKKTGVGIADYEILDTPSGRILNTVLRSGSDMYVSTRAFGGFTNETKVKDGKKYKILDANNFMIESVDFVIQPGFLETNPKIVESIQEDLDILAADEHHIECVDGICGLKINEEKVPTEDPKDQEDPEKEESKKKCKDEDNNENNEDTKLNREQLESLPKESLLDILENIINENKILSENRLEIESKNENQGDGGLNNGNDMMVSAKLMTNYVSYVELLTKMVKYNVEYEKYYDQLIEFLDKDLKLSTDDMQKLSEICDEILKEKDVEESIEKVCEKIKELEQKINDNGEENDDEKEDKEGKDQERRDKEAEEDKSGEVKAAGSKEESFVDFVLSLKEKVVEKEVLVEVEDNTKVEELQGQVMRLKEATLNLTTQLEEALSKEPEKEVVTETKIEYKIPDDLNEKFVSLKEENENLLLEIDILTEAKEEKYKILETELQESISERDELKEELSSIQEKIDEDKEIFKEIVEDYKQKENSLQEELVSIGEKFDKLEATNEALEKTNEKLGSVLFETKSKYYASFYRLELPLVENLMKNYSDERQLLEALKKEEKLHKRAQPVMEVELPEYRPKRDRSQQKAKFLDSLVR